MIKFIKNLIGSTLRDIIVINLDYVLWTYKKGTFIYKNPFDFNFTIGDYQFLKEEDFEDVYFI